MTRLFCRILSLSQGSFAKETCNFKELINRSHPIYSRHRANRSRRIFSERILVRLLRLVGSLKLYVSFAKEPYKRDDILAKKSITLRSLLIVATPYQEQEPGSVLLRLQSPLHFEYILFHRALLQKRHVILRSLLIVATPYQQQELQSVPLRLQSPLHFVCGWVGV